MVQCFILVRRFILLLTCCLLPTALMAQGAPDLVGGIELEKEEKKRSGFEYTQETVIRYLEDLIQSIDSSSSGTVGTLKELEPSQTNYMAALYLYCTQKLGPCPAVLDTLLEIDVINSKLSGNVACPNLTKFWKTYIATDMERRIELDLPVGFINKVNSFNKTVRGQYIKCKNFVDNIITSGPESSSEFFKKRYNGQSTGEKSVKKTLALAKTIEKSKKNLFYVTGIKD